MKLRNLFKMKPHITTRLQWLSGSRTLVLNAHYACVAPKHLSYTMHLGVRLDDRRYLEGQVVFAGANRTTTCTRPYHQNHYDNKVLDDDLWSGNIIGILQYKRGAECLQTMLIKTSGVPVLN